MNEQTQAIERDKYWSELSDAEKIERTRQVVKSMQGEIDFLRSRLSSLEGHVHVGDKIYNQREGYGFGHSIEGPRTPKDDEVFF